MNIRDMFVARNMGYGFTPKNDGGDAQPDWNQNDETAADYVKNRPFYTGDPVDTIAYDSTVTIFEGWNDGELPFAVSLEGKYAVTFNGILYEVTPMEDVEGNAFIGNPAMWWPDEYGDQDNGMPFCIGPNMDYEGHSWVGTKGDDGDYTLKIVATLSEIHKIESKYIDFPAPAQGMHYDAETDEFLEYPIRQIAVYDNGTAQKRMDRFWGIECSNGELLLPSEPFAYAVSHDTSLDVRNLSKGESTSLIVTRDNFNFRDWAVGCNDANSLYFLKIRDVSGLVNVVVNGLSGGSAITGDGKICFVQVIRTDDDTVTATATVRGIVTVT